MTGNAVIDYSSDKNLQRRCAGVFYRRGPSQASLCDDGVGRGWAGAEERAGAQPQEVCGTVPRGLSAVHGCSRGGPLVVCDGGSTSGAGRRGEDSERTSGQSDRPCPDQDRQTRLPDVGPSLKGESHSGGLSAEGWEPAGATGDKDEGLLGLQANRSEEQDSGTIGSAERGSPVGGGKARERALQLEGIGVFGRTAAGKQREGNFEGSSPGIQGDPGAYQEVGRIGERPLWGVGGGVPDRHGAWFCQDVVGLGGGRDRGRQTICAGGRPSFLCWGDTLDVLIGRTDVSRTHHQAREQLAEVGGFGSGLSGDQERPRAADLIQPAGPAERTERGQDRGGPSALDDHLSNADREERLYSGYHETIGCLGPPLTGPQGSRLELGLGAEIECYGAHHGADRRVVQKAEAAMKRERRKMYTRTCVSQS